MAVHKNPNIRCADRSRLGLHDTRPDTPRPAHLGAAADAGRELLGPSVLPRQAHPARSADHVRRRVHSVYRVLDAVDARRCERPVDV